MTTELVDAACIARYFQDHLRPDTDDVMTQGNVHQLLYYAQGFHLALHGRPLFRQALKAWSNHPAVAESWAVSDKPTCKSCLDHDARDFLDEIYSVYGQFAPWKLRDMIAAEPPYRDTPAGADISHDSLRRFFKTRLRTCLV